MIRSPKRLPVAARGWRRYAGLVLSLLFSGSMFADGAVAEEAPSDPDKWKVAGEVYLWGASIGGKSASGSEFEVDFNDIFSGLEMAFMGNLTAQRDKWTLLGDLIYLNVSNSGNNVASIPAGPVNPSIKFDAKVDLKAWVINALAGYNVIENEKSRLDLMGGVRYLYLKPKVKVDLKGAGPLPGVNDTVSDSGSEVDGIVGVRGHFNLSENWYLPYYLDVGTGQSDLTYQAVGGVGYRLKRADMFVTYRYLKWKLDDNDVFDELEIKGPMIGVRYTF